MHVAILLERSCTPDMLAHLLSGGVIFPLGYLWLSSRVFSGPPALQGMLWAGLLWFSAEVIMAPTSGAEVFITALGGLPAALRALLGYLVYGATLGNCRRSAARGHKPSQNSFFTGAEITDCIPYACSR